ncbi:MAG TPA: hypothetical protein PK961_01280 [bacterium]|nr:hypothetical protein [bacterium]
MVESRPAFLVLLLLLLVVGAVSACSDDDDDASDDDTPDDDAVDDDAIDDDATDDDVTDDDTTDDDTTDDDVTDDDTTDDDTGDDDTIDDDTIDDDTTDDDTIDDDTTDDDTIDDDSTDDDTTDDDTIDDDVADDDIADEEIVLSGSRGLDLLLYDPTTTGGHSVSFDDVTLERIAGGATGHNGVQMALDHPLPVEAQQLIAVGVRLHAMTADADGHFHLAYCRKNQEGLFYATDAGGSWTEEQINSVAGITELDLGAGDSAHIVYRLGGDTGSLSYVNNAGGSWQERTVTSEARAAAVFVDEQDAAHLFYLDGASSKCISYQTNASGEWVTSTFGSTLLLFYDFGVARDDDGAFHLAVIDFNETWFRYNVRYITNASGAWVGQVVHNTTDIGLALRPALSVNEEGVPVIVLMEMFLMDSGGLFCLYPDGDRAWKRKRLLSDVYADSLTAAQSANDKTIVALFDTNRGRTELLAMKDNRWARQPLDSDGHIRPLVDMAVGADGSRHVCIYETTSDSFVYGTDASGEWVFTTLAENLGENAYANGSASLKLDSAGAAHIVYPHFALNRSIYATNASGAWVQQAIRETVVGTVGHHALALDDEDRPHVVYRLGDPGKIVYAVPDGEFWDEEVIYSPDDEYSASVDLVLDDANVPHVVFMYDSNGGSNSIAYGLKESDGWDLSSIVSGSVNGKIALALDDAGDAHLVYHQDQAADDLLVHTTNKTGSWVKETIYASDMSNAYYGKDLVIEETGAVHVVFGAECQTECEVLIHAVNDGDGWVNTVVVDEGWFGNSLSLALVDDHLAVAASGEGALWWFELPTTK